MPTAAVSVTAGDAGRAAAGTEPVPFVPVLRFWSRQRDITLDEVRAALEGRSQRYERVVVASYDPSGLWQALGVVPATTTTTVETVQAVKQTLRRSRRALGLIPAARAQPALRALSVDGRRLFGSERIRDLSEWPLLGVDAGEGKPYRPDRVWTLVAGGDVMLDREPYRRSMLLGKGVDYVWDGGFATISSRSCCTVDGGPAITTRRVPRTQGAVRELLSGADVAVVNHEAPAPNEYRYHPSGLIFTVDPAMLEGLNRAGVDVVSLANNHIRNAGSEGVMQTLRNMRRAGLRSFGAGADDVQARRPACLEVRGSRLCLLGYDDINTAVHAASDTRAGAAELDLHRDRRQVRQLRQAGADVIVVWPHWGTEYVTTTRKAQRLWAREMVRAGADVVLGNHSHVVGPVEFVSGAPVFYSLGDLVFDLPRFEATEEGVLVELTFLGSRVVQAELHPTVVHRRAQLNLLERDGDGAIVIERMREASRAFE
jgi:poly-gamma-glutamate capsule biosynthesis protein CapA/YwtB (metallophosphatase superfamily)